MYNIRTRSGSVGRETPSSYRPSRPTVRTESTTRLSRASSCDPSSRSTFRAAPTTMSLSYHTDYSSKNRGNVTSRYASTGNLSSISSSYSRSNYPIKNYRNDYSTSSYRPPTYRASSTFSTRTESTLPPRDYSSSSLSKYRPDSTSGYSRPSYSASTSSIRSQIQFRSKTPSIPDVLSRPTRFDRDYKSLSRFEKTTIIDDKSEDEVENTFQKLYNRYVNEASFEKFINKSDKKSLSDPKIVASEEANEGTKITSTNDKKDNERSVTPKGPSPSPAPITPIASPISKKQILDEPQGDEERKSQTVEDFRLKYADVEMKPAIIEARVLKPAASAMINLLKMDNLTAKVTDAFEKKKTETEIEQIAQIAKINDKLPNVSNEINYSVEPKPNNKGGFFKNLFSTKKNDLPSVPSDDVRVTASRKKSSSPPSSNSRCLDNVSSNQLREKSSTSANKITQDCEKDVSNKSKTEQVMKIAETERHKFKPSETSLRPMLSDSAKRKIQSEEPNKDSLLPPKQKARSVSPRPKPNLTIDTKKAEETSTSITILMPTKNEMMPSSPVDLTKSTEIKKVRDRTRTLENMLKEVAVKREEKSSTDSPSVFHPPPLLLVTQASVPSTPKGEKTVQEEWDSKSESYYGSDQEMDEEYWTEVEDEQDYDSDFEYCISETFRIPTKVDLYPPSIRGSPFVSDYESDCSGSFLAVQRGEDSRGRVDRLFAVPPPIFTCSVSYDGQESWDFESVHSCEEEMDDEEIPWRPTSSSLGGYKSPRRFESDENLDGSHYRATVEVGYTLKLVDKAARKDCESSDSEYYDDEDEMYSEEEYWDEDEEYEEEITDDESMMSAEEKTPSPTLFTASIAESEMDFNEVEEACFEADFELADLQTVNSLDTIAMKNREITYTKDIKIQTKAEDIENLLIEGNESAKAIAKRIKKDGTTETAQKFLVPQMVNPVEEMFNLSEAIDVLPESLETLNSFIEEDRSKSTVNVVPTYVNPSTENIKQEQTSRFLASIPSTDYARKAVIQPTQLEKASVAAVQQFEDKSAIRKSILNMKEEDAKKKTAADEEAAKQKARRHGTVSNLANRFKEKSAEEPIIYRRSTRLAQKDEEVKPRKKYEIIKPVFNDEFDKQMEEIRAQLKAGTTQFQSDIKNLSKGITSLTEEAKKRELDDKHRQLLNKASDVFGKVEEEKQKWRQRMVSRGNEAESENMKQEGHVHDEPEKQEPKRTIRKIKKRELKIQDQQSTTDEISTVKEGTEYAKPEVLPVPSIPRINIREKISVIKPVDSIKNLISPRQNILIDENNLQLFQAVTKVASRKRNEPQKLSKPTTTGAGIVETNKTNIKEAEKTNKNNLTNLEDVQTTAKSRIISTTTAIMDPMPYQPKMPQKCYGTRRKTQEIVNESYQLKRKRKMKSRRGKHIGAITDIDILLGWEKEKTFEMMEQFFEEKAKSKRLSSSSSQKRRPPTKIWISELTDIDKIYKSAEIKDITSSVEGN